MLGERGFSKKSKVFTRQAHVLMPGKRHDLRRDVVKRRLHEDLMETSQN
jgi:hypothetical protein